MQSAGAPSRSIRAARNRSASERLSKPVGKSPARQAEIQREEPRKGTQAASYLQQSKTPLNCLVFLLPLLIAYEVGTWLWASQPAAGTEQRIIAFNWLRELFLYCGVTLRHWPAVAVVVILIAMHIKERRPWDVHWKTTGGMAAESVAWAIPLLALSIALVGWRPWGPEGTNAPHGPTALAGWMQETAIENPARLFVLAIGAGIYEELVFRLIGFAALSFLLHDVVKMSDSRAVVTIVITSAAAFSAYHYLGNEAFSVSAFIFRMTAGVFFGMLYLWRGFGVTAGAHAAYDVMVSAIAVGSV